MASLVCFFPDKPKTNLKCIIWLFGRERNKEGMCLHSAMIQTYHGMDNRVIGNNFRSNHMVRLWFPKGEKVKSSISPMLICYFTFSSRIFINLLSGLQTSILLYIFHIKLLLIEFLFYNHPGQCSLILSQYLCCISIETVHVLLCFSSSFL